MCFGPHALRYQGDLHMTHIASPRVLPDQICLGQGRQPPRVLCPWANSTWKGNKVAPRVEKTLVTTPLMRCLASHVVLGPLALIRSW